MKRWGLDGGDLPDKVAEATPPKLLDAKGSLIKKALGVSKLPIEIQEDR